MDLSVAALESVDQLALVWRQMVLDRDPDADVRDLPGLAVRWADRRFPFWNCIALTERSPSLVAPRLVEAASVMREKKNFAFPGVGVAGDLLPIPEPVHPDLTFERVRTDTGSGRR